MEFESARAALRQQPNFEDVHSPFALRARAALRHHPDVEAALECWWQTAQNSSGRKGHGARVERHEYIELWAKIHRAMIGECDTEAARKDALKEWHEDTRGATNLPEERLKAAIFELADLCKSP